MRIPWGLAALASAPLVAACTLLVSTDGFEGEAPGDASAGESGADDGSPEGGPARPVLSPDGAPSCTDPGAFCDSFDEGLLGATWSGKGTKRGAIALDEDALSPPRSFKAEVTSGSGLGEAFLYREYTPPPRSMRCELDVKPLTVPAKGNFDIIDFYSESPSSGTSHDLFVGVFDGVWKISEFGELGGPPIDRTAPLPELPQGAWSHLALELSGDTIAASVDGKPPVSLSGVAPFAGKSRSIVVGVSYAGANVGGAVLVDNVACLVLP